MTKMGGHGKSSSFALAAALCAALLLNTGCASEKDRRPPIETRASGLESSAVDSFTSGDHKGALSKFTEALAANRSVDNRAGELADLINIGRVSILLGETESAIARLHEAAGLAVSMNDEASLSEARSSLAKAYYALGDGARALAEIDSALAIDARLGRGPAASLNLKAAIYSDAGKTGEARGLLKKALKAGRSSGDDAESANALRLLAAMDSADGNGQSALRLYEQAYEYDRAQGDPVKIAIDLKGMAGLHLMDGRAREAAFLFERHYAVANAAGLIHDAMESLEELIKIHAAGGDGVKAAEFTRLRDAIVSEMPAGAERNGAGR